MPTGGTVNVRDARIDLPFLRCTRTATIQGDPSVKLESYRAEAPFALDAATVAGAERPRLLGATHHRVLRRFRLGGGRIAGAVRIVAAGRGRRIAYWWYVCACRASEAVTSPPGEAVAAARAKRRAEKASRMAVRARRNASDLRPEPPSPY